MTKIYKIRITDCSKPTMWYNNKKEKVYNAICCKHPFREAIPVYRISTLCWVYAWDVTILGSTVIDLGFEKVSTQIFSLLQTIKL